jgi:molybdopterin/thiamine biosynthesis adenylyltransferase
VESLSQLAAAEETSLRRRPPFLRSVTALSLGWGGLGSEADVHVVSSELSAFLDKEVSSSGSRERSVVLVKLIST